MPFPVHNLAEIEWEKKKRKSNHAVHNPTLIARERTAISEVKGRLSDNDCAELSGIRVCMSLNSSVDETFL